VSKLPLPFLFFSSSSKKKEEEEEEEEEEAFSQRDETGETKTQRSRTPTVRE